MEMCFVLWFQDLKGKELIVKATYSFVFSESELPTPRASQSQNYLSFRVPIVRTTGSHSQSYRFGRG